MILDLDCMVMLVSERSVATRGIGIENSCNLLVQVAK